MSHDLSVHAILLNKTIAEKEKDFSGADATETETILVQRDLIEILAREQIGLVFERKQRRRLRSYLPSVECTWASVMRNQQKVCSFHRELAMAPGLRGDLKFVIKKVQASRSEKCSSLILSPVEQSQRDIHVRDEIHSTWR